MNEPTGGRNALVNRNLTDAELAEQLTLVELVNRVLDRGVVVAGEVVISVAGVDLVYLGLQLVLTSTETLTQRGELPPGVGSR